MLFYLLEYVIIFIGISSSSSEYVIIFFGICHHIFGICHHIYWNMSSYLLEFVTIFIGICYHIYLNMNSTTREMISDIFFNK